MEAPRQGVPRHGKAHRLPGHLQAGGEIKVLGEVELAALLVEDAPLPGGVALDQGAVAAEEILGLAGPALFRAGSQRQEVGQQALVGCVIVLAVGFEAVPVGLGHQAVVDAHLDVIGVAGVAGPAQEVVRQAQHVVHGAVLLVLIPQAGAQRLGRGPDFPAGLAAGGVLAPLVHGQLPVGLYNVPPPLLPGDLIGAGTAQHLGDGGVGVHIGQHVLALQQGGEQALAVVALQQGAVLLRAGVLEQLGPHLQHAACLKV